MVKLLIGPIAQDKGISKGLLSRRANVTLKAIRTVWDNPYHNIEIHTLEKIAKALGVTICDLIEEEDSAPPQ